MNKKPSYEELVRRVEELERRVKELEAQPRERHIHYYQPAILPVPQPTYQPITPPNPVYPYIGDPLPNSWPSGGSGGTFCGSERSL